jgi:membrane protein implicated in regulation of membrane protease activity
MLDGIDWEILVWVVAGVISGLGEIVTGTFFLVPVAAGAFAAAIVAALGADTVWVVTVFFVVALVVLAFVFWFAAQSKDDPPATSEGALRYVGASAAVVADIDSANAGRVRLGGESWGALSATGERIETGAYVRVREVRGSSLVVEPE